MSKFRNQHMKFWLTVFHFSSFAPQGSVFRTPRYQNIYCHRSHKLSVFVWVFMKRRFCGVQQTLACLIFVWISIWCFILLSEKSGNLDGDWNFAIPAFIEPWRCCQFGLFSILTSSDCVIWVSHQVCKGSNFDFLFARLITVLTSHRLRLTLGIVFCTDLDTISFYIVFVI